MACLSTWQSEEAGKWHRKSVVHSRWKVSLTSHQLHAATLAPVLRDARLHPGGREPSPERQRKGRFHHSSRWIVRETARFPLALFARSVSYTYVWGPWACPPHTPVNGNSLHQNGSTAPSLVCSQNVRVAAQELRTGRDDVCLRGERARVFTQQWKEL